MGWALWASPTEAAFTGLFIGLPLTLLLAAKGGVLAAIRRRPASPPIAAAAGPSAAATAAAAGPPGIAAPIARRVDLWPAVAVSAVATAVYWFRVWAYPGMEQWELEGVLVLLYALVAFWWPGVFVGVTAWFIEAWAARVRPGPTVPFRILAAAGLVAGVLGGILYVVAARAYYARIDRVPLGADVRRTLGILLPEAGGDGLTHRLLERRLVIAADVPTLGTETPYSALRRLEAAMDASRRLLRRIDTDRVTLLVSTGGAEVLRFEAGEGDRDRPVWGLATLRREGLRNAGRLDVASLLEMREFAIALRMDFEERDRLLQFPLVPQGEVALRFVPPGPLSPETAAAYASAWATANNVLRETVGYFPEIERFQFDLAEAQTVVERAEVGPGFLLQHRLVAPGRILGLIVRRGDSARQPAEPAWWATERDRGLQVAVAVFDGPLASYPGARLFEEVNLAPGVLYVAAIEPDGTVTVFIGEDQATHRARLVPGATQVLGERTITNAGWLSPEDFTRRR